MVHVPLGNIHLYNNVPAVFAIDVTARLTISSASVAPPPNDSRWPQTEDLLRIFELLTDGHCRENFEARRLHLIVSLELLDSLNCIQKTLPFILCVRILSKYLKMHLSV